MLTQGYPRLKVRESPQGRAQRRRVLALEVSNPGADSLSEHIGSITRGRPELIQNGRRIRRVPVP